MNGLTEKQWILFAHLGAFLGFVFPFGNIVAPLLIYSMKKESPLIRMHSRNSLNFQLSITIYIFISFVLVLIIIGVALVGVFLVLQVVFVIIAALKADKDEMYHYPITIEFVKD